MHRGAEYSERQELLWAGTGGVPSFPTKRRRRWFEHDKMSVGHRLLLGERCLYA